MASRFAGLSRFRNSFRHRRGLNLAYRIAVGVVGAAIIVLGALLLPLPGPGWVIIFLGLGVLASEFAWAKRLLRYVHRQVTVWTTWLRRRSLAVRGLFGLACAAVVVGCLGGYLAWRGVPDWLPFIG